ncbi:hypothetical protein Q3G72_012816 [Acer saccharum]|nr:hypothetical protein Q3G72_012816 [Acer saccharum]
MDLVNPSTGNKHRAEKPAGKKMASKEKEKRSFWEGWEAIARRQLDFGNWILLMCDRIIGDVPFLDTSAISDDVADEFSSNSVFGQVNNISVDMAKQLTMFR